MHLAPDSVGRLSLVQFNNFLHQLGKRINWELQMAAVPGGNRIDPSAHPLRHDISYDPPKTPGLNNSDNLEAFELKLRNFVRKT